MDWAEVVQIENIIHNLQVVLSFFFFKGRKTSISYVTFLLERERDWNDTQEIVPVVTLKSGNNSMWEGLGVGGCVSHSPAGHTWQTQGNMKTVYLQRDHVHSCRCNGT